MSLETDVNVVAKLLDPPQELSHKEALALLKVQIGPRGIRRLRHSLEAIEHNKVALDHAREKGPEWLTSPEGRSWLEQHALAI
jgi:hypothetical protein